MATTVCLLHSHSTEKVIRHVIVLICFSSLSRKTQAKKYDSYINFAASAAFVSLLQNATDFLNYFLIRLTNQAVRFL